MTQQTTDYDSPWKEVIEVYFTQFIEFFFPQAYTEIDWQQPYEFLDTELQHLEPEAEIWRRLVDKVAKPRGNYQSLWGYSYGAFENQSNTPKPRKSVKVETKLSKKAI